MTSGEDYDLLVIGGGINGAGIARDAAGRGLRVALAEAGDLACATSSASTKLIHGGLRYLEYFEFRLVAEALAEREVLLSIAPHVVWPLEFVLPHERHLRPAWMIRAGLFLYDHLGARPFAFGPSRSSLPGSRSVRLDPEGYGAGLGPLYDDGSADSSAVTRDYHLLLDEEGAPLLSVFGGKITTYRRLAEHALDRLGRWLPDAPAWTHAEPLPGGDFGGAGFDALLGEYRRRYPAMNAQWLARLLRRHGTLAGALLGGAKSAADLGEDFGGGLYEAELRYLVSNEWAREAGDVLWRRTKCGLHMTEAQRRRVAEWLRDAA